jgi:hypothetical protein
MIESNMIEFFWRSCKMVKEFFLLELMLPNLSTNKSLTRLEH